MWLTFQTNEHFNEELIYICGNQDFSTDMQTDLTDWIAGAFLAYTKNK